jgi:hypothetical protein
MKANSGSTHVKSARGIRERKETRRFNVVLPAELLNQLQEVAHENHTTTLDLIKRFVKLGLLVVRAEKDPDLEFLIRERGVTERVKFF